MEADAVGGVASCQEILVKSPRYVAGESVLLQRAVFSELWETDWNASSDGLLSVVYGIWRGVDHFTAAAIFP